MNKHKQKKQGGAGQTPPTALSGTWRAVGVGTPPKKKKRRRLKPLRVAVFVLLLLLLAAGIVTAVVLLLRPGKPASGEGGGNQAVFGLKSITVEGSTHYTEEEIIQASGLSLGQSIFSVNKRTAAERILQAFPYVERVTVKSPSFTTLKITIEEAEPIAVTEAEDGWFILGENGKGLEKLPDGSGRAEEYLKIRCTLEPGAGVGSRLMSDEDMELLQSILTAISSHGLTDIREIDLKDNIDLRLRWKDQITILLGSDINLDHKMAVLSTMFPLVLKEHGDDTRGQIDLSSYSNADPDKQQGVYTPEELLTTTTPATTAATEASGTGTTAAPAGG